jgi:large-conductance mechanosensitive channel
MYNSLNSLVRRIKKIMRESYTYLFTIAVASILAILIVVTQPLFASPLNWSNFNLSNFAIIWTRFIYALPLIVLFAIAIFFIVKQIRKIDKDKDDKFIEKLTKQFKIAFKEALKEDREEQRKDEINNGGNW